MNLKYKYRIFFANIRLGDLCAFSCSKIYFLEFRLHFFFQNGRKWIMKKEHTKLNNNQYSLFHPLFHMCPFDLQSDLCAVAVFFCCLSSCLLPRSSYEQSAQTIINVCIYISRSSEQETGQEMQSIYPSKNVIYRIQMLFKWNECTLPILRIWGWKSIEKKKQ